MRFLPKQWVLCVCVCFCFKSERGSENILMLCDMSCFVHLPNLLAVLGPEKPNCRLVGHRVKYPIIDRQASCKSSYSVPRYPMITYGLLVFGLSQLVIAVFCQSTVSCLGSPSKEFSKSCLTLPGLPRKRTGGSSELDRFSFSRCERKGAFRSYPPRFQALAAWNLLGSR